jgi:hypothetical protein
MGRRKKGELGIVERIQNTQLIQTVSGDYPAVIPPHHVHVESAKDLMVTQPDVYASIVKLLSEGHSPGKISRLTSIDTDTVRRIRSQHPEVLEALKASVLSKVQEGALTAAERLLESIDEISVDKLALSLGILIDKAQLLAGEATSRHEVTSVPSREDLAKALAALPSAQARVIEAEDRSALASADLQQ